jgi:enterochelin esterase-like enzyme
MRIGVALGVLALVVSAGCGSSGTKPARLKVTTFALQSKLLGRTMYGELVTPAGGAKRPLLVFLHGYGAAPSDTLDAAFESALRKLGPRAPAVLLPEGDDGWWHDRVGAPWARYVLDEEIPAALKRTGADPHRVAIGGISMGGFGALDLGRLDASRFCAVGGHSPAVFTNYAGDIAFAFDGPRDFRRHDLLRIARHHSPYRAPVWIDVGASDQLRPAATALARELRADGAKVSFHVWPGEHSGQYWDAHFAQYLRFYADACE